MPKIQRDNPFAEQHITENDIKQGIFDMVNKGMIPKDVDLTPAFCRGVPVLVNKPLESFN